MTKVILYILLIITVFSCERSGSNSIEVYEWGGECDTSFTSTYLNEDSGDKELTYVCIKSNLRNIIAFDEKHKDTAYILNDLSDKMLYTKGFEDGRKRSERVIAKVNGNDRLNYFKVFDDEGKIKIDKSYYFRIVESHPSLKFEYVGHVLDSLYLYVDLREFIELSWEDFFENSEKIRVDNNFFELNEELFFDGKCVIAMVFYTDSEGYAISFPFYLDSALVEWHKQKL